MELRDLQYFLAVAQEGNISAASNVLHVAQPSLSRQMKELEEELGKTLFIRGSRKITLTEEGLILSKRAEEMLLLMRKTEKEIADTNENIVGDLYIGAAETKSLHYLTKTAAILHESHPNVHFHIASGDTTDTLYQLEQGLIDFALLYIIPEWEHYNHIELPIADRCGVLMRRDSPLAEKESVSFKDDLIDKPLIISRLVRGQIIPGTDISELNVIATYNLAYNASLMVKDGLGYAICFDSIINTNSDDNDSLCFVPLPELQIPLRPIVMWKKHQALSKAAERFIDILREVIAESSADE